MTHPIYINYEGSNLGRIRSLNYRKSNSLKELKLSLNKQGYLQFGPWCNKEKQTYLAHRFIWECFNGLIPENMEIDHINTIRTDNRIENLRCCTSKENSNNPLSLKRSSATHKGITLSTETKERMHFSQINNLKKSKPILQFTLDGEFIKEWPSSREVQRTLGFLHQNINKCCRGIYKQSNGFKWAYSES